MWELDCNESWVPKNWCFWTVVLEKTLVSPLNCKEIQLFNPKGIQPEYSLEGPCWSWNSNTLATWCEELTHLKRPWCWQRLKAGGEGDNRGWDGCITTLTRWTWDWPSSTSWWCTRRPGVLHSVGSQRVRYKGVTELNWTLLLLDIFFYHSNEVKQISLADFVCICCLVSQSCPTLCNPMDCRSPLSLGILQAKILEWVALPSPSGIFPTKRWKPGLWPCRQILYWLSHQRSPSIL